MQVVDLSMPIAPHFRWRTQLNVTGDIKAGDQFRISRIEAACHGFSHVDAQAHILADAPTIEETPLDRVVGPCRILRLADAAPGEAIGPERLAAADPGGAEGEILLLAAAWDRQRDPNTPEFWRDSPWLTREAAEWLLARRPSAVAFDFPQDYPIRLLLDGISVPFEQHVTHDVVLRAGITLIEYLVNTTALAGPRTLLCAAPLKIPGADGAPARIFAIEGLAA
ncbi:cyclase family protein [Belnapia sp. T6]|uniref:Cyclase family protein n=1 Tax=Belnapia mucosa TaxID=2804532 RepID=A0ABS1V407_9PROT|nr:cyclase family protein [Belnapia mucosa]MBL6456438.1 cyclase family protein [Belnapia mucosa]